jgi:hypothetical protein
LWTEKTGEYPLVPNQLDFASCQCAAHPETHVTFLMPNLKCQSRELVQTLILYIKQIPDETWIHIHLYL